MPELRWILLILGALLIAGLWYWELRRHRPQDGLPAEPEAPRAPAARQDRHEPRFGDADGDDDADEIELPSMRADDRPVPHGNPPVVTLDDLPEDTDRVVLGTDVPEPRRYEPMTARRDLPGAIAPEAISVGSSAQHEAARPMRATRPEPRIEPRIEPRLEPLQPQQAPEASTQAARPVPAPAAPPPWEAPAPARTAPPPAPTPAPKHAAAAPPPPAPGARPAVEPRRPAARPQAGRTASPAERLDEPRAAPAEPPSPLQKIIALRLVAANGDRIDGAQLRAALEAEGLRFGKYSIFHRQRADGRAIYSVASLLEPGSFDLDRMDDERYPGVSLFAVFPGPVDAAEAFDELLATVRRLADRLPVLPQDERGATLGAQRALAIREELVHFQGLVDKTRARPGG